MFLKDEEIIMGFFNKKKKDSDPEEIREDLDLNMDVNEDAQLDDSLKEDIEKYVKDINSDVIQNTLNEDGRRYTMLVEEAFSNKNPENDEEVENKGILLKGNVEGKIKKGDMIYCLHPGMKLAKATVKQLIVNNKPVDEAKDCEIGIIVENLNVERVFKYMVVTSITPMEIRAKEKNGQRIICEDIENPALSGLMGQYNKFCKDQEYLNVLTYRIVHALFITAIYDTQEDEDNEVTLENGHTVKKMVFPLVANDKNGSKAVPVFTDMVSFNRWINVFDKQKGMVVPNSFQVMSGVSLNGNNGIVINPFNLDHIFIPNDLIKNIMNTDGYKQEFGPKQAGNSDNNQNGEMQQEKINANNQIKIGIPKRTEQLDDIEKALREFGEKNINVKEIYMFIMIRENNRESFFCIMDIPKDPNIAKDIFEEASKAIKPYIFQGQRMEFAFKQKAFDPVTDANEPFYKA